MSVHDVVLPYESSQNEHVKDWHPSVRTQLNLLRDTSLSHKFVSSKSYTAQFHENFGSHFRKHIYSLIWTVIFHQFQHKR